MRLRLSHQPQFQADSGGVVALQPRDAALLAWLALEGPTPRSRLAALLWPESDQEAARNALRQRLFHLRRILGTDAVAGQRILSLAEGLTHDLLDADQVLGDATPVAGGEFPPWLEQQRARRLTRVRQSLAELAAMAEGVGDWDDAVSHAQEIVALEPLSEDAHRRVMRLHYLSGNRAAALLAFDRCERVLKDEVGTRPDAQTLALLRQIELAEAAGPLPGSTMPAVLLRPPRLVGRTTPWALLEEAWDAATPVLVRGEAGLGKSRLLADFIQSRRARAPADRLVVVGARPGDASQRLALVSRLLRALVVLPGWHVPPAVQGELAAVLPELGPPPPSGPNAELRLLNAVVFALSGLAALVIDDLHWADADSLALLHGAMGVGPPRWLFATRPADGGHAGEVWQARWLDASQAQVIDLLPLNLAEVDELLTSLGASAPAGLAAPLALHSRSGGNPLFLLECVKAAWAGRAGMPAIQGDPSAPRAIDRRPPVPVVQRHIQQRLMRCSPLALRLLRCAAVAGQDFNAALAAAVLQTQPLDLADAWAELERAQVLTGSRFAHDLVYEAALASVPAPIAVVLHGELASALAAAGAAPQRIAEHWILADQPGRAAEPLLQAARHAQSRRDDAQAGRWFVQAADILEQLDQPEAACDALLSAAEVQSNIGASYTACVGRIAALARTEEQALFADILRCAQQVQDGDLDAAQALARAGVVRARAAGLAEAESEFEWTLFHVCYARGELAEAIGHGERDLAIKRTLPAQGTRLDQALSLGTRLTSLAQAYNGSGRFLDARARHEEALDYMVRHRMVHHQALGAANFLSAELVLGQLASAQALGARIGRLLDEGLTHEHDRLHALNGLGVLHGLEGQWGLALQRLDEMEQALLATAGGFAPTMAVTRVGLLLTIGRRDLALQSLAGIESRLPPGSSVVRVVHDVYRCAAGAQRQGETLLAAVSAIGNLLVRVRLLLVLAPQVEAKAVLPLLTLLAAQVRDGGGWGLWLALQARRASALSRLGHHDEAASAASTAWQRHAAGIQPMLPIPDFAADLAEALSNADPAQSAAVSRAGLDTLAGAAATLEPAWRRTCLERSPLQLRLASQLARLTVR